MNARVLHRMNCHCNLFRFLFLACNVRRARQYPFLVSDGLEAAQCAGRRRGPIDAAADIGRRAAGGARRPSAAVGALAACQQHGGAGKRARAQRARRAPPRQPRGVRRGGHHQVRDSSSHSHRCRLPDHGAGWCSDDGVQSGGSITTSKGLLARSKFL